MKAFNHATPKRTMVISNSPGIKRLDHGKMTRADLASDVATTDIYYNKAGTKKFTRNRNLTATQSRGKQPFVSWAWVSLAPSKAVSLALLCTTCGNGAGWKAREARSHPRGT